MLVKLVKLGRNTGQLALALFSKDLVLHMKREVIFPVVQLLGIPQEKKEKKKIKMKEHLVIAVGDKERVLRKIWKLVASIYKTY